MSHKNVKRKLEADSGGRTVSEDVDESTQSFLRAIASVPQRSTTIAKKKEPKVVVFHDPTRSVAVPESKAHKKMFMVSFFFLFCFILQSAKVNDIYASKVIAADSTAGDDKDDDVLNDKALWEITQEVLAFGSSNLAKKDKKAYERERLISLGARVCFLAPPILTRPAASIYQNTVQDSNGPEEEGEAACHQAARDCWSRLWRTSLISAGHCQGNLQEAKEG
jgi:hypothetical protein